MLASLLHGDRMHRPPAARASAHRRRRRRLLHDAPRQLVPRRAARGAAQARGCPGPLRAHLPRRRAAGRRALRARVPSDPGRRPRVAARPRGHRDAAPVGRDRLGHPASPVAARILARVVPALGDAAGDLCVFFEALARLAPVLSTVRRLARHLRICPSTLMSRFYRAGLPSPKTYLAGMRLLHAAYLFLNPGLSVGDVAYRLDYSSPQSFGRHLKAMLGVTAGEFRRRFPFDVSLERYVDLLITPYRERLRAFYPLTAGLWDQGPNAARVSRAG